MLLIVVIVIGLMLCISFDFTGFRFVVRAGCLRLMMLRPFCCWVCGLLFLCFSLLFVLWLPMGFAVVRVFCVLGLIAVVDCVTDDLVCLLGGFSLPFCVYY